MGSNMQPWICSKPPGKDPKRVTIAICVMIMIGASHSVPNTSTSMTSMSEQPVPNSPYNEKPGGPGVGCLVHVNVIHMNKFLDVLVHFDSLQRRFHTRLSYVESWRLAVLLAGRRAHLATGMLGQPVSRSS